MKYSIIFVIIIALMAVYIVFGHNGVLKYGEMVSIRQGYEEKIRDMDSKLNVMREELNAAKKDKEFMENIIRRELGMQKNGEDQYIVFDNETGSK